MISTANKTQPSWEQNNESVVNLPPEDQGSLTTQHDSARVDEFALWQDSRNGPFSIYGSCYGILPQRSVKDYCRQSALAIHYAAYLMRKQLPWQRGEMRSRRGGGYDCEHEGQHEGSRATYL